MKEIQEFTIRVKMRVKPSQIKDEALQSLCVPIAQLFKDKFQAEAFLGNVQIVRGSIAPKDNGIDYTIPTFD